MTTDKMEFGELEPIDKACPTPTILQRITGFGFAIFNLTALISIGIFVSSIKIIKKWSKGEFLETISLDPLRWRDSITANGISTLLKESDQGNGSFKRTLIYPNAQGNVLEIGAGTGLTLKYYNPEKVSHIYLVEPCLELHEELRESIARLPKLKGKTTIIPYGIEKIEKENDRNGLKPNSIDTISIVQVLCSIEKPEEQISFFHSILKKGGKVLIYEHIISNDPFTAFIQSNFTQIWKHFAGNCRLNRDPRKMFADHSNNWKIKSLMKPKGEGGENMFPHLVAEFVKS